MPELLRVVRGAVALFLLCGCFGCGAMYAVNPRFSGRHVKRRPRKTPTVVTKPVTKPRDPRAGKLGWPVPGPVVGNYGVVVDPRYGTKTRKLGIDIDCATGAPVKAAYPGRVSFSDKFMGYGRTVIVDHGDRLHSIYSRLKELKASVGAQVRKGEIIGYADDTLHFQVRKEGKSVDPRAWLGNR